ncbi:MULTISPECIES: hypothetical protein [unclassified Nocardia]|uniref:hypothetical protein n=1 Tax=unclassified Nocardia TaxID=2637762 RepID=UPI00278BEE3E|nr:MULTISPECIES: hypothetical protein [unclassified Nocardia]
MAEAGQWNALAPWDGSRTASGSHPRPGPIAGTGRIRVATYGMHGRPTNSDRVATRARPPNGGQPRRAFCSIGQTPWPTAKPSCRTVVCLFRRDTARRSNDSDNAPGGPPAWARVVEIG